MFDQRFDEAVERLVRHGFARVTAADEDQRLILDLVEKRADEHTLTDSGISVDVHEDDLSALCALERVGELRELSAPAGERKQRLDGSRARLRAAQPEPSED